MEQLAQAFVDVLAWFLIPFATILAVTWVVSLFRRQMFFIIFVILILHTVMLFLIFSEVEKTLDNTYFIGGKGKK